MSNMEFMLHLRGMKMFMFREKFMEFPENWKLVKTKF